MRSSSLALTHESVEGTAQLGKTPNEISPD